MFLINLSYLRTSDLMICFCNHCPHYAPNGIFSHISFFHENNKTSPLLPPPLASLPKVENLTISNITPYGFRVSWEVKQQQKQHQHQPQEDIPPSSGGFSHFLIVVTDSGWLLEPQEFTVPGNQSHLEIWGLITGIGYEVRLTGVSESGLLSRPLTTVAVTGTNQGPSPYLKLQP